MRCYVEPSPAGGYFVRLRGEPAPVSRHDTEEEAEAAAAAYDRGLARLGTFEHVMLADGSEVLIRPILGEDKPRFVAGWKRLSEESVYRRFLQLRNPLTVDELRLFTEIDHVDHEAIGALDAVRREGIGVARYVRDPKRPHAAEAAVTVVDAWQHRGVGRLLLRRLCNRASENGVRVFTAHLLASNEAMLALLTGLGAVHVKRRVGAAIEVDVEWPVARPPLESTLRAAAKRHPR